MCGTSVLHCIVTYSAQRGSSRLYVLCSHDFTMDKSLAVQTTAYGQTQPLWQGWRRKGGRERERGGREGRRETKMLTVTCLTIMAQVHRDLATFQARHHKYAERS